MMNLRTLSIFSTISIVLVGVFGTIAVGAQQWVLATVFGYVAVILTVITVLLATRYTAVHARTGERNARVATNRLAARLKSTHKQQLRAVQQTQQHLQTSQEVIDRLDDKIVTLSEELEQATRATARNITSTVRDSTRQIESMLQLYGRYAHMKLPMPSSGGWAIDAQALAHMIALIEERKPKRILELGSGTSTIWVGYLCQEHGSSLMTVDHLPQYLALTETAVNRHGLTDVIDCRLAP